jgi:hypothetical protein
VINNWAVSGNILHIQLVESSIMGSIVTCNGFWRPHRMPISFLLYCGCVLLQTEDSPHRYRGMFHAFRTIIKEEGARAVYKGWLPSVIGVVCTWTCAEDANWCWTWSTCVRTVLAYSHIPYHLLIIVGNLLSRIQVILIWNCLRFCRFHM